MSGKKVGETLAALGVIASLVFVGVEIRQNTVASKGAAYQAIGTAVAESWLGIADDPRKSALFHVEQFDTAMMAQWEPADWAQVFSVWVGWNRLQETLQLQIEGDLLPSEAASRLGFPAELSAFPSPAYACLWPRMRTAVDPKTRDELDRTAVPEYCSRLGSPESLGGERR